MSANKNQRVAIAAGLRTPFARQGTALKALAARDLGKLVVKELLQRTGLDRGGVQRVLFGQVIPTPKAPNIAREVVLGSGLPATVDAFSVARACATSYQATVSLAQAIMVGEVECGVAGGAESASDVPITVGRPLADALVAANRARSLWARVGAFRHVRPRDLLPLPPALKEPSSDYTMGEAAEKMARENGISRQDQDAFAHRSHKYASRAWKEGFFTDQVMTVHAPPDFSGFPGDNLVRADSNLDDYAALRPVFDRRHGTITAGNSSPLTDGAAALVLMREDYARAQGFQVLGFIRSYAFTALDPNWQMLLGPAFAVPLALRRAGIQLDDLDVIDMHEAFAAQVLSNTQALASHRFAREYLQRDQAVGEVDWDKLNPTGGSIALGHPFAATGARQILQTLMTLKQRAGGLALCTACAAGGLGAALVLEAAA